MSFFFFNDTATTEIYTLSLHDALPIYRHHGRLAVPGGGDEAGGLGDGHDRGDHLLRDDRDLTGLHPDRRRRRPRPAHLQDRKSTRLNSSHANISYAVFCLKKKTECVSI